MAGGLVKDANENNRFDIILQILICRFKIECVKSN